MDRSTMIETFADFLADQDRSPLTIRGYLADLELFARWLETLQGKPLEPAGLDSADVRAYRQALQEGGARPQTINRKLAAIAAFGHWLVQTGQAVSNPALHVRSVEDLPLAPKWLDRRQRLALTRAVENDLQAARKRYPRLWVLRLRDAAMTLLLLHTGLRVGELCNLQVSDVQISERKGNVTVRRGKGNRHRTVPLNGSARQELAELLTCRPVAGSEALFIGQRGERVVSRSVQRAVERFALEAGLKDVTPHTLRHSFAKALIDEGVTLEKVAALLGHSNLNTTRIYTTPGERDLEEAVAMLD